MAHTSIFLSPNSGTVASPESPHLRNHSPSHRRHSKRGSTLLNDTRCVIRNFYVLILDDLFPFIPRLAFDRHSRHFLCKDAGNFHANSHSSTGHEDKREHRSIDMSNHYETALPIFYFVSHNRWKRC